MYNYMKINMLNSLQDMTRQFNYNSVNMSVSPLTPCPYPVGRGECDVAQNLPMRNYCVFNEAKVDYFVKQKEPALPYLKEILANSNNEPQITETLYILNRMKDAGTKGIEKLYPVLSRFNNTNSPNIQTFLAGIYRKIQVPDAFGPLVAMLIRNSLNPPQACFDPNEEVGGAVLSYLSDRFRN